MSLLKSILQGQQTKKILRISAINPEMLAEGEQHAILANFSKFLNGLTFPVQIICRSEIADIDDFMTGVSDSEFKDFLEREVKDQNIVIKNFYLVFVGRNEIDLAEKARYCRRTLESLGLTVHESDINDIEQNIDDLHPNYVVKGDKFHATLHVYDYPQSCRAFWLSSLYNLEKTFTISQFVVPVPTRDILRIINRKITQMGSTVIVENLWNRYRDQLDSAIEDAESMRMALMNNADKFFYVGTYINVSADSFEQLEQDINDIKNLLNSMMISARAATFRHEDGFKNSLPLGVDYLEKLYNITTSSLQCFFPFVSPNIIDKDGYFIGKNLSNNTPLIINPFRYENANIVILGKSGAGKSFTLKKIIEAAITRGVEVDVLDYKNEFTRLNRSSLLRVWHYGTNIDKYLDRIIAIWEDVCNRPRQRLLVIEEAAMFTDCERGMEILQRIAKLCRQYWLGLVTCTQEIEDFLANDRGRSIINNSSIQIIMRQKPNQLNVTKNSFTITDSEYCFLASASVGEGIIYAGNNRAKFKALVSPGQHSRYTTNPEDIYGLSLRRSAR